jgi:hypothetical protein
VRLGQWTILDSDSSIELVLLKEIQEIKNEVEGQNKKVD